MKTPKTKKKPNEAAKKQNEPKKPKDADWYRWDLFLKWAERQGIDMKYEEDWNMEWETWKAGFIAAMN